MSIQTVGLHISNPNEATVVTTWSKNLANSQISFIPADPIEFGEWTIPDHIQAEFLLRGIQARIKTLWKIEMSLVVDRGIPYTKKISVSVEGQSPVPNLPFSERVEKSHLSLTSSELRELEVLVLQAVREKWKFNPEKNSWEGISPGDLSEKEIARMRKEILNRTSYRSLDSQFLKEVANLYAEAESKGERTNVYVATVIGRREGRVRTAKTAEKWIAESRRQGFLEPSNRKKPRQKGKGKTK